MNLMKRHVLYLMSCLVLLVISGCAETPSKAENFSESEACNRIQGLIVDHATQFQHHKKTQMQRRRRETWTAEPALPSADNCQIWEWGDGLTNYYCQWNAEDGESEAKASYEMGRGIIQRCLGDSWKIESNQTTSGGERTVFSRVGSPTVVSIRYFKEQRALFDTWNNTLVVGDKSNLNVPVQ
ncbi:hypothetical protein [Methylomonas sp. MgM2]